MTDATFYIRKAKEFFLHGKKGRFRWVEKIIDQESLLTENPQILLHTIAEQLDIDAGQINYNTFISWLVRYRKKRRSSSVNTSEPEKKEKMDEAKEHKPLKWLAFTPSEAISEKKEEPVFEPINFNTNKHQ